MTVAMMNYLSLDIGDKRIGIAFSQSGILASGLETYQRINDQTDTDYIFSLVQKYKIGLIIAGLPIHLNGDPHLQAEKNEVLCQKLRERGIEIEYWDERFSSAIAEKALLEADLSRKKRKQVIDKMAAAVILQSYLDYING